MDNMRAAQLIEQGRVECVEAPVRPSQEGELLVRTYMASICGSDLHVIYHGVSCPPFPQLPGFPGHEGVGEVVISKHPDFQPGDQVLTCPAPPMSYSFSEYQTLGARFCIKLPSSDVPQAHLLMAQQLGTVIYALRKHPLDVVGRTVAIMGQGSAGMFFAYLLKRAGAAKVIVSDLSEARLAASRNLGADVAVKVQGDNVKQSVMDHTGGQGADLLVEAVGSQTTLLQAVDLVRPEAGLLLFGLPDTTHPVPWNFHDFFRKKLQAFSTYGVQHEADQSSFRFALELIARGEIDVAPLVSHVFPIEQVDEAVRMAHDRSDNALKVSIDFQTE